MTMTTEKMLAEKEYAAKTADREMGPVEHRCSELDTNLQKLEEWVGTVEEHLRRVLTPTDPTPDTEDAIAAERKPESLIANRVRDASDRVDKLAYRMARLDARIES